MRRLARRYIEPYVTNPAESCCSARSVVDHITHGLGIRGPCSCDHRQPPWNLRDFDQSFYTSIAYDLDRYGVFSNGVFESVDRTREAPAPGMFFVPGYPLLVLTAMKIAPRFAAAVRCSVEANNDGRGGSACEPYAT